VILPTSDGVVAISKMHFGDIACDDGYNKTFLS